MIELLRYARVKPQGLASAHLEDDQTICVEFKRFDVENGKEVEPERSLIAIADLRKHLIDVEKEAVVVRELLSLIK